MEVMKPNHPWALPLMALVRSSRNSWRCKTSLGICSWRLCLSRVSSSFSVLWPHISASISTSLGPPHHSTLHYHRLIVQEQGSHGMNLWNGSQNNTSTLSCCFHDEIMSTTFPVCILKNSHPLPPNQIPS